MNHIERIDAALAHRPPDRTPCFEYVFSRRVPEALLDRKYYNYDMNGAEWAAYVLEVGVERALRAYARDRLELSRILMHDMLYVVPNPGLRTEYKQYPHKQTFDPHDPEEALCARNERARWEFLENGIDTSVFLVYDILLEEMDRAGERLDLFVPTYMHGASTDSVLLECMLLAEDAAHAHFALQTDICRAYIAQYAKRGIRHIGVGGDFSGNRPIISPECYRKFIVPEVRKTSRMAHAAGAYAVNASDGDLWSVIDDFLIACEADAYMEIDARAGMEMAALKARYGGRVCLYGNIDCGALLSFGTQEEIRAQTVKCLMNGAGGGHIFTASNAITETIPVDNYLAMVNAYRDVFGLAHVRMP